MSSTLNNLGYSAPIIYKDKDMRGTVTQVYSLPCDLVGWRITNPNSTTVYCKFFDALVADVSLGITEPIKEFMIPAMGEVMAGNIMRFSHYYFKTGMAVVFVQGIATSSTTAPILSIDVEIYYTKPYR